MIIKKVISGLLSGAAMVSGLMLVATGYSDRINPAEHPSLACLGMAFPFIIVVNVAFVVLLAIFQWRRLWIPITALAVCYGPIRTYTPVHILGSDTPPEGSIMIMSYNVCTYGGNYKYDQPLDTIGSYIERLSPDILCIQEDQCIKHDAVGLMARLYPYNDTVHISTSEKYVNAVGMHSRFPIVGHERIYYDSRANGSVAFKLLINGDTIIVVNNHLESTHLSDVDRRSYEDLIRGGMDRHAAKEETRMLIGKLGEAMATRAPQADVLHAYVEANADKPLIVCGDFNDTPISYTRHTVAKGLTDCYVETGCGPGLSYNRKGFNFRIDHILCSEHFTPYGCKVDNKMDASDHYPIYCWLKMEDNH